MKQVGCGLSKAVSVAKQSAAGHFRKKSTEHLLRSRSVADCQRRFHQPNSPQLDTLEKKCGTFIVKQVGCGLLKAVSVVKQSAAGHFRKKVWNIYCEASRLRTADEALWTGEARTHALCQVYKVNIVSALVSL